MNSSPFRDIVLPALLASSAGFAFLTWPMTSPEAVQLTAKLPAPVSNWLISSPVTAQQKEFSIRYVGLAILSSVAIGIGTAEAMRTRQLRAQRQQTLLKTLTAAGEEPLPADWSQTLGLGLATTPLSLQSDTYLGNAIAPNSDGEPTQALDWSALLQAGTEVTPDPLPLPISQPRLVAAHSCQPCRILATNGQRCLAIQVDGEYYRFYRRRPNPEKTQALATRLQQSGTTVLLTHDPKGYAVWSHEPKAQLEITPGSMGLAPI